MGSSLNKVMKVKELIEELEQFNEDTEVYVCAPDFSENALDQVLLVEENSYRGKTIIIMA